MSSRELLPLTWSRLIWRPQSTEFPRAPRQINIALEDRQRPFSVSVTQRAPSPPHSKAPAPRGMRLAQPALYFAGSAPAHFGQQRAFAPPNVYNLRQLLLLTHRIWRSRVWRNIHGAASITINSLCFISRSFFFINTTTQVHTLTPSPDSRPSQDHPAAHSVLCR